MMSLCASAKVHPTGSVDFPVTQAASTELVKIVSVSFDNVGTYVKLVINAYKVDWQETKKSYLYDSTNPKKRYKLKSVIGLDNPNIVNGRRYITLRFPTIKDSINLVDLIQEDGNGISIKGIDLTKNVPQQYGFDPNAVVNELNKDFKGSGISFEVQE